MKITFWWRQPSGYFDSCTRALVKAGHEVTVVYERSASDAPFRSLQERGYDHLADVQFWSGKPSAATLTSTLNSSTDVLVVASWGIREYVVGAAQATPSTLRLLGVDSPWRASAKQRIGQFTHRRLLARGFDGAWVTGAPQRELVRRLGFTTPQIMEHLYCCDSGLYTPARSAEDRREAPFLFVGRLVESKGLQPLCEGFRQFRQISGSQRRLRIVGNGDMQIGGEGIDVVPFAEPAEVRGIMDNAYALVHPAFLEHWGVVVHEAASMGLPLVLGPSVHAGSRFLSHGLNGFYVDPDPNQLSGALRTLDQLDSLNYCRMSDVSRTLGSTLNLGHWVDNFEQGVEYLRFHSRRLES